MPFKSFRRACALSQSKIPPQERQGLFDVVNNGEYFGPHAKIHSYKTGVSNAVFAPLGDELNKDEIAAR
jgi:hypothetical protein